MTPTARWLALGILVVSGFAIVLSALIPSARDLLQVSTQRQPEDFVELAFAQPEIARTCPVIDGGTTVNLQIVAHGDRVGRLPISLKIVGEDTSVVAHLTRHVDTVDGRAVKLSETLATPTSGAFSVVAQVSDGQELIRIGCGQS